MNKKFKRALSSILAFAMVLSMMTVLNVSTAFALTSADISWVNQTSTSEWTTGTTNAIQTDTSSYDSYWINNSTTGSNLTVSGLTTANTNRKILNESTYVQTYKSSDATAGFTVKVPANSKIVIDSYWGGKNQGYTISGPNDETGTESKSGGANKCGSQLTVTSTEGGTYTFVPIDNTKVEVCAIGVIYSGTVSVPAVTIYNGETALKGSLNLTAGGTATLTATVTNLEDTTVTWNKADGGSANITLENGVVSVAAGAAIGETATFTATANGDSSLTASCTVTVVAATKTIYLKHAKGVNKVTLTSEDGSVVRTYNFKRDGSNPASRPEKYSFTEEGASKATDYYVKTVEDLPLGTYTVTSEVDETYYTAPAQAGTFTISAESTDYETYKAPYTVPAGTAKADGAIADGDFDYAAASGKTLTWDFTTKTGNSIEYLALQYMTDYGVYTNDKQAGLYLVVNTESGKFNSVDRAADIQMNSGTVIKIYATPGTTAKVVDSKNNSITSFDADTNTTVASGVYTYNGTENGTMTLTANASSYPAKIVVTYPEVTATPTWDATNSVITGTDGTIYYVVGVTAANQASKTSYTLSATDTTTGADVASVTDNVVYTGVEVEGTSFTAADMGFDAYVVAFIIQPNAVDTIDVSTLKTKYEMTYSPE